MTIWKAELRGLVERNRREDSNVVTLNNLNLAKERAIDYYDFLAAKNYVYGLPTDTFLNRFSQR